MDTPDQDHVRELTAAFLDAHRARIIEALSERLGRTGASPLLSQSLFDLTVSCVREPSGRRLIRAIRKALDRDSAPDAPRSLISGQMVLWSVLHRTLRDTDGPHGHPEIVHAVLALAGDTADSVIGALIDVARSGAAPSPPPGWGTLGELGRTHRELQTLHEITQHLLNAQDPPRMFETLEAGILGAFHIRSLAIVAVNHEKGFIEFARAYPASSANLNFIGQRCDLSHPDILCDVARTGRTEVIDGWDPRYHEWVPQADGSIILRQHPRTFNAGRTAFFVPILAGGRTIGLVCTASAQSSKQIVLHEIERMLPFLGQVGVTLAAVSENIERRRAEEALQKSEEGLRRQVLQQEALLRIGQAVQEMMRPSDLGRVTQVCLSEAQKMGLNVQAMAIHRILDPEQRLIETYRVGPSGVISNALRRKGISIVMAWKSGEVRYDSDLEKRGPEGVEAFRDRFAGLPIRAHLDVPFSRGVISALSIHPDAFTETDVAILRQVAEIYSVGISRVEDLERIGEVEREAEQRRVLTETAGAAAHEINQPLTVVLGLTQLMLLNQALDPALRHDLETIHKAGQQIREIVGKMISLRQYVTKPYIKDVRIVDFDAGSRKD